MLREAIQLSRTDALGGTGQGRAVAIAEQMLGPLPGGPGLPTSPGDDAFPSYPDAGYPVVP